MKKITLLLCISICTFSITAQITGTVSDEIGPLAFANIVIKNSTKGTISDHIGQFSIDAQKGDTLVISFVGYTTKDIAVNHQKDFDITLGGEVLDEVIVIYQPSTRVCIHKNTCYSVRYGCRISVVGVAIEEELSAKNLTTSIPLLYPNPSSNGHFNLKLPANYKEVQLYVTSMNGRQLQSKNYQNINQELSLDLSRYPTGMYLINLIADGERLPAQKVVKR